MRCQKCGLQFEDHTLVGSRGASENVTVEGNAVRCQRPGCGGVAVQAVNATYNIDEQGFWTLVHAVKPDDVTLGDYERALEAIERGQAAGETDQKIADEVVAAAPVFAPGRRSWVRQHQASLASWLGALGSVAAAAVAIAVAAGWTPDHDHPAPAPPAVNLTVQNAPPQVPTEQVADIVRRELEKQGAEQAASSSPGPTSRAERRATSGRNAPCSCGSGRKTKHCCGKPGAR